MNRKCKEIKKKDSKNSPVLFEDEENGTSSSNEAKVINLSTPTSGKTKICSGHSTPIQTKYKSDSSEFPDMDYNESPIEPLTQHPPSEVGWDYQRPIIKEEDSNTSSPMEITKTPKRSILLSKKRNSNSPLLYKPLKKKLVQEEQQQNMAGFMKELKAIKIKVNEIKAKKEEKSDTSPMAEESQLVVEIDSQPYDDSDIKLQVSVHNDESPNHGKITTTNKNYEALLDDSIEDIMVMCSQEVEAKEFEDKKKQSVPTNTSKERESRKNTPNSSLEKMFNNLAKENVQPLNSNEKVISDTSSKNSSVSKEDSNSLEIPDDSFDEFFVEIDDKDLCKNVNAEILIGSKVNKTNNKTNTQSISTKTSTVTSFKTSTNDNNFFHPQNSTYTSHSKNVALATYNCVTDKQASNASVQTKIVNAKANFGYLNKDYAVKNSHNSSSWLQSQSNHSNYYSDRGSETRLFKSKSYSDSNFQQSTNLSNNRSTSNLSIYLNQKVQTNNVYQNSTSTYYAAQSAVESKPIRRIQSSSSLGKSNIRNDISQQSTVNCAKISEQSQSTPAEIEKKRLEAIMKREAKMKSKLNPTLNRPTQNFIKR